MLAFMPLQHLSAHCVRSMRTASSTASMRLVTWQVAQAVARALNSLPCQVAPTHASGKKPGFCVLPLPPRHSGEMLMKPDSDGVSLAAGEGVAAEEDEPDSVEPVEPSAVSVGAERDAR